MGFVNIFKNNHYKIDYSVKLQMKVSQHSKEKLLLNNLMFILGSGIINKHSKNSIVYKVSGFNNINKLIIFFTKYEIKGIKLLDF